MKKLIRLTFPAAALASALANVRTQPVSTVYPPTSWPLHGSSNRMKPPGSFVNVSTVCIAPAAPPTPGIAATETPAGGVQARGHIVSTADLYIVNAPPWDPSFAGFGSFVGTWTFVTNFAGPVLPDGRVVNGFVETGQLTHADGTTSHVLVTFRLVLPPDGPPTVFFVKAVCGG
jgi:hypothetical protein